MYLQQVKDTAQKALEHLDETEYKDYKLKLSQSLDNIQGYIQSASAALSPTPMPSAASSWSSPRTCGIRSRLMWIS
uniref:Uncharacterized protein n=2 Tax=Anguilla anguilla TaxID=7936 RepID=A0A0E9XZN9_ANGAN